MSFCYICKLAGFCNESAWSFCSSTSDIGHDKDITIKENSGNNKEETRKLEPELVLEWRHSPSLIRKIEHHGAEPDYHRPQGVQHLPGGSAHVLGDGYSREVKECNWQHRQRQISNYLRFIFHLSESIYEVLFMKCPDLCFKNSYQLDPQVFHQGCNQVENHQWW